MWGIVEFAAALWGNLSKFYIKGDKTLYAFIEGQPEYELVPTDKNKFELKSNEGYNVAFEENAKGEIVSANFVQPRMEHLRSRKKIDPHVVID
jgi:hypothetical protein